MSKGKPRHNSNKLANQYGSRCPYYEEYIDNTCGCEVHPEIAGDKLKCGGNRHNCVKVQYQKQAIKKRIMAEIQVPDVSRPQESEKEPIETNLYKVMMDGWHSPAYVAAENQQQAVDKVAPVYEIASPEKATIQYVGDIII